MPRKRGSGAGSSTKPPHSAEALIDWMNHALPEAEEALARAQEQESTTGRFKATAVRLHSRMMFSETPIRGIERTKKGFIIYCDSPKTAKHVGREYFHAQPITPEMREKMERATLPPDNDENNPRLRSFIHTDDNRIHLATGAANSLRAFRSAITTLQNPVSHGVEKEIPWERGANKLKSWGRKEGVPEETMAQLLLYFDEKYQKRKRPSIIVIDNKEIRIPWNVDSEGLKAWGKKAGVPEAEIKELLPYYEKDYWKKARPKTIVVDIAPDVPCIFPEVAFESPPPPNPRRRIGDSHPSPAWQHKRDLQTPIRRRASDRETPPPTFEETLEDHPLMRILPKVGELVGNREPLSVLERLRRGPAPSTTNPRSP